jgi:hypothetical protein
MHGGRCLRTTLGAQPGEPRSRAAQSGVYETLQKENGLRCSIAFYRAKRMTLPTPKQPLASSCPRYSESDVHRVKRRYREVLREDVAHTVELDQETDATLRHLLYPFAKPRRARTQ